METEASTTVPPVPEERFGLDGKWDVGVGVWLEAALTHQKTTLLSRPYQLAFNAGVDYTFGVGNGLTTMAELLPLRVAREGLHSRRGAQCLGAAAPVSAGHPG